MIRKLYRSCAFDVLILFSLKQMFIRKLFRWWGRYFESRGKIEDALGCYRKADDNLSLCRLLCEQDQPDKVGFLF